MYRGGLTREIRTYICILNDPFVEVRREQLNLYESPIETLQELCLRIIENMVYCGIDDEYKKIGALHALTALTGVSIGARTSLPWLYESLIF